ncbi:YtxH domain-containing protein [Egibacter rhizosphaerae]|uniref:YtxH domain-containing protein n=1 Tax=Egibacter rhizosphaerae TaxID=1670831 RepID=A0A411YBM1_9ACTN|nr:YtxH domain-containing protein [Egibacter rhizosphaerae]QBI18604.1 YtxH domain-containing protein [Egibacter rhizosphaerae]
MRLFRFGLVLGLAIGYIAGAAAGRQRYEQIRSMYQRLSSSGPAQQLSGEVRDLAGKAGGRLEDRATQGVSRITDSVKRGGDGSDDPTTGR